LIYQYLQPVTCRWKTISLLVSNHGNVCYNTDSKGKEGNQFLSYIDSNIELIRHALGTPLATPLRIVKGLSTLLRTMQKLALKIPTYQYIDESMVTVQASAEDIWNASTNRFKKDYSVKDTRNGLRMLALGGMIVPCTWKMLNKEAKNNKLDSIRATKNESGYHGTSSVYMIPDLSYFENLHCNRITHGFSIKESLTYLSVSTLYDYDVANLVFGNLNNWAIPTPSVNQAYKLATLVRIEGVITLEEAKKYLVPSRYPEGYTPPTSNAYFINQLNALKMTGWMYSQGIFYDYASKVVPKFVPEGVSKNSKVLYTRPAMKQ